MNVKSLGLKSDLLFYRQSSIISSNENYLKIETPDNPEFFWGNLLIFKEPPKENDFNKWIEFFKLEFGKNSEIKHMTFTWDIFGSKPAIDDFINAGFNFEEVIVLIAEKIKIEKENHTFQYKIIESDEEWDQVVKLQVETGIEVENYNPDKYESFVKKRFDSYKKLCKRGLGFWFGAFDNNTLIADLGLFGDGEFCRFQSIETRKSYRKLGLAQNLMKFASNTRPSQKYIIEALQNGPAIDMYMRIGFEIKEVLSSLTHYNSNEWKQN